jgi:hypothetical protein
VAGWPTLSMLEPATTEGGPPLRTLQGRVAMLPVQGSITLGANFRGFRPSRWLDKHGEVKLRRYYGAGYFHFITTS